MPRDDAVGALVDLGGDDTSFVVDPAVGGGVLVHWGAPLGAGGCPDGDRRGADDGADDRGRSTSSPRWRFVPEHGSGFPGRPGLSGHRSDGRAWAPRFSAVVDGRRRRQRDDRVRRRRRRPATRHPRESPPGGAMHLTAELVNEGDDDYWVDDLAITLALPPTSPSC